MTAPPTTTPHELTAACAHVHCHSCGVDEPSYPAYIACAECGHVYRTARELRRAYRRAWDQLARPPERTALGLDDPLDRRRWRARLSDRWGWLLSRFTRARSIHFCQECLHDF